MRKHEEPEDDDYARGVRFGCLLGVVASVALALLMVFGLYLRARFHLY